jgi:hypothetical protein
VADKNDPLCFLAATAPVVTPPQIWASGDSGRSWIDLPLGDMAGIPDLHINNLAAIDKGGFITATNFGVYYIGDIFQGKNIIIENDTVSISSCNEAQSK